MADCVWIVEELDCEDGPNDEWLPIEGASWLKKRDAMDHASGRRAYLREVGAKKTKVRIWKYRRVEDADGK